jgi:microcin C transport system permease protein
MSGAIDRLARRWIKNEQNFRRFLKCRRQKRSTFSLWLLLTICFFSFTAEFWSNSKPVYLNYGGKNYFPVFVSYHPSEFGITDRMNMNYHDLVISPNDRVIWSINPWDPFESNKKVDQFPSKPTGDNWFGTDDRGRDIFARLLYGFRYSFMYAVVVWMCALTLAIVIGGSMGFFGGRVDIIGQRIIEVFNNIPFLFLLIILVSIFEPSLGMLIVLTSVFSWVGLSAYIRGEFLKNRKMDFVEAARSLGAKSPRLIFKHILPNSLVPIITFSPFIISSHILGLASLDYLGFGLTPPTPSWGEMLNQAQKNFTTAWWLAVFPGLALIITLVLFTFIGDGVRNAYDPKKQ